MVSLSELTGPLLRLLFLVGIVAVALGLFPRLRCCLGLVALVLVGLGAFWLLAGGRDIDGRQPAPPRASRVAVTAAADGGWVVDVPAVEDASRFTVVLDGVTVTDTDRPGATTVFAPLPASDTYLPGPVHEVDVVVDRPGRKGTHLSSRFCAPVVLLAARGTGENPPKDTFAHGVGSRAWRTWHNLAGQVGVLPSVAGHRPTAVDIAAVRYPATWGYAASRDAGKRALRSTLREVAADCPDTRVVLIGYSQGADVTNSVLLTRPPEADHVVGAVGFADPHFDRRWVDLGIARPRDAVFENDGAAGARRVTFDDDQLANTQQWCLPKDPVCQGPAAQLARYPWHGPEYDVYEQWAAYELAPAVAGVLARTELAVPEPIPPAQRPSTEGR